MDRKILAAVVFVNVLACAAGQSSEVTYVKLKPTESRTLECVVPEKSAVEAIFQSQASVTWRKYQQQDGDANPMGTILNNAFTQAASMPEEMKPHVSFKSSTTGDEKPFSHQLMLKDVEIAESGKYECEVEILATGQKHIYTYFVQVLDPIDEVIIYSNLDANSVESYPNTTSWTHQSTVTLGTRTVPYLACVARGGYPIPSIKVYIGDRPITGLMKLNAMTYKLIGDVMYRRVYETTRLLATNNYPVDVEEDGATIRCEAIVEDEANGEFSKLEARATLVVNAKPSFNCSTTQKARLDEEDFQLRCEFLAKPQGSNLEWRAQNTGDIIRRTDGSNNGFTATMQTLEGEHRYAGILTIGIVQEMAFQPYTLSVSNAEGTSEITITLVEGDSTGGSTTGGAFILSAASTVLTILMAAVLSISL